MTPYLSSRMVDRIVISVYHFAYRNALVSERFKTLENERKRLCGMLSVIVHENYAAVSNRAEYPVRYLSRTQPLPVQSVHVPLHGDESERRRFVDQYVTV